MAKNRSDESSAISQEGQQGSVQRGSTSQGFERRNAPDTLSFPSPVEFFQNPFGVMRRMHEDMDRAFSQALGGTATGFPGAGGGLMTWAPAIEVTQRGNDFVVCAELPGLRPEEVHLEATEDALILRGERRQEQESAERGLHRTERRYGQFYREIPLPEGANAEQAKAQFNHGLLEITIPVTQQQNQRRQIPIESGGRQASGASSASGSSTKSGQTPSSGPSNPSGEQG